MNYNIPLVLEFVYNRLKDVDHCSPDLDWMMEFKSAIKDIKTFANSTKDLLEIIMLQREMITKTEQILDIYKKENAQYQQLLKMHQEAAELTEKINLKEHITAEMLIAHARTPENI